jgi:hypothetical protein
VVLFDAKRRETYRVQTDMLGNYVIELVDAGHYTLQITAAGYKPYRMPLYVPSDFESKLAILLKRTRRR